MSWRNMDLGEYSIVQHIFFPNANANRNAIQFIFSFVSTPVLFHVLSSFAWISPDSKKKKINEAIVSKGIFPRCKDQKKKSNWVREKTSTALQRHLAHSNSNLQIIFFLIFFFAVCCTFFFFSLSVKCKINKSKEH